MSPLAVILAVVVVEEDRCEECIRARSGVSSESTLIRAPSIWRSPMLKLPSLLLFASSLSRSHRRGRTESPGSESKSRDLSGSNGAVTGRKTRWKVASNMSFTSSGSCDERSSENQGSSRRRASVQKGGKQETCIPSQGEPTKGVEAWRVLICSVS